MTREGGGYGRDALASKLGGHAASLMARRGPAQPIGMITPRGYPPVARACARYKEVGVRDGGRCPELSTYFVSLRRLIGMAAACMRHVRSVVGCFLRRRLERLLWCIRRSSCMFIRVLRCRDGRRAETRGRLESRAQSARKGSRDRCAPRGNWRRRRRGERVATCSAPPGADPPPRGRPPAAPGLPLASP